MSAVIFKAKDYYGIMADECKYTLVGRFIKPRLQIDHIITRFKELIPIKRSIKIRVYDNYNVFIDPVNEDDYQNVWFRRRRLQLYRIKNHRDDEFKGMTKFLKL
ncbi:hypothetical protein P3L10_001142 [Capsicum annuum]